MKKVISVLLTVMLVCLCFTACGGGSTSKILTKEEMLEQAGEDVIDVIDINNESFENLARAKENYSNKIYKLKGTISEIAEDHIVLGNADYRVDVYLQTEDIVKIENGQNIVVVGETSDEITETEETAFGSTYTRYHFQMPTAYLIQETIELTGILRGANKRYAPAFDIKINGNNYLYLIYFKEGVDTSSFKYNQEIKFSAKAISSNSSWKYIDAEIID